MRALDDFGGGLTDAQRIAMGDLKADMAARAESRLDPAGPGDSTVGDAAGLSGMAPIEVEPVLGRKQDRSLISFYAAGIAVMFLLFSASGGAGALLDEVDSGTLERVLGTRVGMTGLLAGKWLWLTLLGTLQIVVMFLYAALAFRLDLLPHLVGFAIMTPLTAATCAAFGLVLATACRTRAQLSGISTLVILLISALGGSMWPRFLMSDWMQRAGQVLFNAWALEGYRQVFWRDAGPADLLPHVAFLVASTAGFLLLARLLARRWEHA
jgi:ABC-2 type transport system permease protein